MRVPQLRVVVVVGPRLILNPMCGNWLNGLTAAGHRVVCLYWADRCPLTDELAGLGIRPDVPVRAFSEELAIGERAEIVRLLGGEADLLFGWEGILTLHPIKVCMAAFPDAARALLVDTYPLATSLASELAHIGRYTWLGRALDGFVFYSDSMRQLFQRCVPTSRGKPWLAMVEPFPSRAYSNPTQGGGSTRHVLERHDGCPHVVFTGNASMIWSSRYREAREAVGGFLARLAGRGIHVFLNSVADLRSVSNFHHYPAFSNAQLLDGTFAGYLSEFDAHLVIYHEVNGTIRRRVASGLSTRMAFAMTSTCPIAVSRGSRFVEEYWGDAPFGFAFDALDDLVESLNDGEKLRRCRLNMEHVRAAYSFEAQTSRINRFLNVLCAKRFGVRAGSC